MRREEGCNSASVVVDLYGFHPNGITIQYYEWLIVWRRFLYFLFRPLMELPILEICVCVCVCVCVFVYVCGEQGEVNMALLKPRRFDYLLFNACLHNTGHILVAVWN